ncbi:MAG: hypothetical protein EA385_08625 [Salinarimonadaceae bacterium]|nr:MAG: hypothetical protein EA385_08625 [Salinarimonadaceae bacterium]
MAGAAQVATVEGRRNVVAFAPLVAVCLAAAAIGVFGVSRFELTSGPLGFVFFSFFFDTFAPLSLAIVYGVARLSCVAVFEPGRARLLRVATAPLAIGAFLAITLYPTFGGLVARAAFFSGGMAFVQGQAMLTAYPLGIAVATLLFGLMLGAGIVAIRLRLAISPADIGFGILRFASLVFAGCVLVAPGWTGVALYGDWPVWPLSGGEAATLAAAGFAAFLPHALIVRARG